MIHNLMQRKPTLESNKNQTNSNYNQKRKQGVGLIKYPLLRNKQDLTFSFEQSQLYELGHQLPYYLNMIKFIILGLVLLTVAYTLPLTILLPNANQFSSNSLLIKLSAFNAITSNNIELLAYFSILLICIHFVVIILLSIKLKQIKQHIADTNRFPVDYALFMRMPAAHLKEQQIVNRIEGWFDKQIKRDESFSQLFPELLQKNKEVQEQQYQSIFSNQSHKIKTTNSNIIQTVLLSFNYEDYLKLMLQVNYLNTCINEQNTNLKPAEINALIQVYNKKKNILNVLPTNEYCLVVFKKINYTKYFYQNNQGNILTSFFCPESYSNLQIESQSIEVFDQLLPNQIKWQELHYDDSFKTKKRLASIIVFSMLALLGIGCQFGAIYLQQKHSIPHSSISALLMNIIIFISNRILRICINNQPQPYYSSAKKTFVLYATTLNILFITIFPFIISYLINPSIIYKAEGYLIYQIYLLIFYAIFTIANIYVCSSSQNQRYEMKQTQSEVRVIHEQNIECLLTGFLTVLSIAYFLAPFFPLVLAIALGWFILMFGLQRYNIVRFYDHIQYHGEKLIYQIIISMRRTSWYYIVGLLFLFIFASLQFNYTWSPSAIAIICLVSAISLLFQFVKQDKLFMMCSQQKNAELLLKSKVNYSKAKQHFIVLYESFNFALSYNLKHNNKPNSYSTRIKMYEQLNTMSKTLSLSLKQQLFRNVNPILAYQRKATQQNEVYFQYQKKIHMQKSKPKMSIPPLFKKQQSIHMQNSKQDDVEMKNFNSIFSSDDREGRKMLKNHILNKLNQKAVQK